MTKRQRVDVSAQQAGLQSPFASLDIAGLPPGPEETMPARPHKGRVLLRRETAHRGGKTVVVAGGFDAIISDNQIEDFAKKLKAACGCGGTVRGREIELQGEQAAGARHYFESCGFRVAGP